MFSVSAFFNQFIFKFLTLFFTVEFGVFSLLGGVGKELPKTPDNFKPVVRFTVCSDVHLNGKESDNAVKYNSMFKDAYAYAESCEYNKLDAVIVAGDMTGGGAQEEYDQFNLINNANIKEGTQFLSCLGNHEFIDYRDEDPTVGYTMYQKNVNKDVDTHTVINGYHFIGVSYSDDAKTFNGKLSWLRKQLDIAVKDTGDKPIFVFQHPQPFNTVYGSINWGNFSIKTVLVNYPQVIDFSGHSHYASSDPRSIWQGTFTAVGTGSITTLMGNLDYISGDEDAPGESGSFWIVEADKNGNVRLMDYDVVNHRFFERNDYYLTDITKQSAHRYTWGNMKSLDTAPEFPENAKISAEINDDGSISICFPDADCFWKTEDYKIIVSNGTENVFDETVISNYVRSVSNNMNVNLGELSAGKYEVIITPYTPYAKSGDPLYGIFEIK